MQEAIGKSKWDLDTPCLILDKNKLTVNINTLQATVNKAAKNLRPHVKTHKCLEICKLQVQAGAIGIAAAKVSEALVLAQNGFKNTLITSPVVTTSKIASLLSCLKVDPDLTVVVDNLENAATLNSALKSINQHLNILIDIDPAVGRTGVAYDQVLDFAQQLAVYPQLVLRGIQCYAGNLQHICTYEERRQASLEVMRQAGSCRNQLQQAGFNCDILTGSGTGTYLIDLEIPHVTEVQPGSYTVMDAEYGAVIATPQVMFQPAMTLLTTVVSVNHPNQVTCDAGWKAMYAVPTKPNILTPAGLEYDWFGDEHGKITRSEDVPLPRLGSCLELQVAHCDPTINLYDAFYVVEDDRVIDVWLIAMRGKSQ